MPLKIIGAGFGRTGTMSVYTALNALGFPCYHMKEVFASKGHPAFWYKVASTPPGTPHDWEEVFTNYCAAVDFPASCVWRELMAAYPDAKVLLTLHPKGAGAWYDSTYETIYGMTRKRPIRTLAGALPWLRRFFDMTNKLIWQRTLKGTMPYRDKAIAQYHALTDEVKAAVPADRLLVFSADQGWKPLCEFLGVPAPATPFPRVNERAEMKKRMRLMRWIAYGVGAIIAAAAIYGLIHALAP
jgi:hypothetical protein